MAREFIMPGRIFSGPGALEMARDLFPSLGRKALLVTDPVMVRLGNAEKVKKILHENGISSLVFDGVTGEPNDRMVDAGLKAWKENGCDFLVAVGGGSCIDTMKAVGCLAEKGGGISQWMGKRVEAEMPPMVAIPTTAGTGSETTQFTIITDTEKDIKMLLAGACLMPRIAVIDPQFTMTAPPKVTAHTGLDALCHCVEAYTSRKAQPLSDTFALSAVRRIFRNLPRCYTHGDDEKARSEMALAATEAGVAFNNASVTLIHGMSRPIGALFHVPHGLSNAMLMGTCLSFALPGAYGRFAELGRTVGVSERGESDEAAARHFLDAVVALAAQLDTPSLGAYGIDRKKFFASIDKMAHDAMESGSPQNTIRPVSEADVVSLYKALWD